MSDAKWGSLATAGSSSLSFSSTPLGHLVKLDLRDVKISGVRRARDVFVHPEVRACYRKAYEAEYMWVQGQRERVMSTDLIKPLAPGSALVRIGSISWLQRAFGVSLAHALGCRRQVGDPLW